ncbi:MAG: hypothetical protein EBQ78_09970 [Betaproteobacteria bacterium]|nr:hypothetical protein [Betaproteobacteria bacterium]
MKCRSQYHLRSRRRRRSPWSPRSPVESLDPASFNAAYEVLRRNAELLRDQEELDIDRLVPLVEQSMQAYRICRSRLDAVRLALESRLGPDEGAVVVEPSDQ